MNNLKSPEGESTPGLPSLIIRDAHIWTKNATTRGSILVERGRIQKIARRIIERADEEILARRLIVLPGLIDGHVHLRDMKLLPEGNGWLLAEFGGESKAESDGKAMAGTSRMVQHEAGFYAVRVEE